ncbi:MAG: hypothetical protein AAF789_03255 [Bacteroidota bacterium]
MQSKITWIRTSVVCILGTFLIACEPEFEEPFRVYLIPQGKQSSTSNLQTLQSNTLRFEAMFDYTAIYQTKDEINQHDINKLYGFSDCNSSHHENSARFGWRWLEGRLEIFAYTYVNGDRISEYICSVPLGQIVQYEISFNEHFYFFQVEGYETIKIERGDSCTRGLYYRLFPYFGGDEVAPHDIAIRIRNIY